MSERAGSGAAGRPPMKARHHWVVRLTHWVNVAAVAVMVGSGLRTFNAYPRFARRGETFCCWPWEGTRIPEWLTLGGWLGGARELMRLPRMTQRVNRYRVEGWTAGHRCSS